MTSIILAQKSGKEAAAAVCGGCLGLGDHMANCSSEGTAANCPAGGGGTETRRRAIGGAATSSKEATAAAAATNTVSVTELSGKCLYCDATFDAQNELMKHVTSEHLEFSAKPNGISVCKMCNVNFETSNLLLKHLDEMHKVRHRKYTNADGGCGATSIKRKSEIERVDQDEIGALEMKLKKAKTVQTQLTKHEDYLDVETFEELNIQLEVMRMEKIIQKAAIINNKINEAEQRKQKILMSKVYRTINKQLEKASNKCKDLMKSEDFMPEAEFLQMSKELKDKKKQLDQKSEHGKKNLTTIDKSEYECLICFIVPTNEVWSCGIECDNVICNRCKTKIKECPTCGADIKKKPFRRNRMLERILQK